MTVLQDSLPMNGKPVAAGVKPAGTHPFAPLSGDEIINASSLVKAQWPPHTRLHFKTVTLCEPPKADVLPYLEAEHSGHASRPSIDRRATVDYYIRDTNKFHEATVNLSTQSVESNVRLASNIHAAGDISDIIRVERLVIEDPGFQAEVAKLELPKGTVIICDPWCYGSDDHFENQYVWQVFVYMRDPHNPDEADSNYYALPLPISPVVDNTTMKIIRIDMLPMGQDATAAPAKKLPIYPPSEYVPEYQKLRTDLKPLQISQPEGVSFTVKTEGTSHAIDWQKWTFRVGFNQREGMVLYDVRYDGRPLFYRLSLSDMNIPYADPRHPFYKKSAFDLGDVGAGITANNLKLGCDCLGSIHYLSSVLPDDHGNTVDMPNVICIHEQDAGISWKHVNYRTDRAVVARSRELVLQSIITVSNYEYILAFMFNQAGELMYEARATGILSTQPIDPDTSVPWGTVVHPGVLATYHQHLFSLRIDPMIDGVDNRLVYEEAHAMPRSELNPHGTGYVTKETAIEQSGGFDLDFDKNRVFKIQNTASRNPINNKPVGYKIMMPPFQKMLSDPDSYNWKRAEFADRNIYAVGYREGELHAGGQWTNQSHGGTGVRSWAARKDDILDRDLVLFVQFGMNHIPRVEDFPVMPCEVIRVALKPVNFFDKNPALDVPPSTQKANQSTLASEAHHQPSTEGVITGNGTIRCCENGAGTNRGANGSTNGN